MFIAMANDTLQMAQFVVRPAMSPDGWTDKNWTLCRCVAYNFSEHRQTQYGRYSISRI